MTLAQFFLERVPGLACVVKCQDEHAIVVMSAKVEKSEYCQQVLRARMQEGSLPNVPICDDVLVFKAEGRAKDAEITVGGFPCQAGTLH